jgi:DNA-binding transcriptional ArsR family regulator
VSRERAAPFVLRDPEHFKALGHPVRHRLVNLLRQRSATLRQLAEALSLSKGTTAYHAGVLQNAGMLQVVETRRVRGGTEQYLALVSDVFTFEDGTAGAEFLYRSALAEMLPERPDGAEKTMLRHLRLTPAQARDLTAALRRATPAGGLGGGQGDGRDDDRGDGRDATRVNGPDDQRDTDRDADHAEPATYEAYGLLISLYRADIPLLPPDEPAAEAESSSLPARSPEHD